MKKQVEIPTYEMLEQSNDYTTRTALTRGYVSRKSDYIPAVSKYAGRYGTGYTVLLPNYDSTSYCIIKYYIAK